MTQGLIGLLAAVFISFSAPQGFISPLADNFVAAKQEQVLADYPMDLSKRYDSEFVNGVFRDNIILALRYLNGESIQKQPDWEKMKQPFTVSFILRPGEVFAFHDNVLPEFKDRVVKTMGSHFVGEEGYRSDGFLYGDGVCHLASLINWAASEAELTVTAKVDHSFMPIFGVPKVYGTSINSNSQEQNLYIQNNFTEPVEFKFEMNNNNLGIKILRN